MARNRDRKTKQNARLDRIKSESLGRRVTRDMRDLGVLGSAKAFGRYDNEASYRPRGRRGVRARRREARIAQRQANGTYRQPTGGTITNS